MRKIVCFVAILVTVLTTFAPAAEAGRRKCFRRKPAPRKCCPAPSCTPIQACAAPAARRVVFASADCGCSAPVAVTGYAAPANCGGTVVEGEVTEGTTIESPADAAAPAEGDAVPEAPAAEGDDKEAEGTSA